MNKRVALQEAFKLALSMMLMFWLALWMNWDMPGNGGLAILLVSLGTAGASFNKGLLRLIGTTIGVVVGFVAVGCFGQSPWGTLVFFTIYLIVIGYLMQMTAASYALYVAGFVPLLVWSSSYASGDMGTAAFHYGSFRYLETTTGILIYTIISVLIWPIRAGDALQGQGAALWAAARGMCGNLKGLLAGEDVHAEGAAQRTQLAGALAKFTATLRASYGDSSGVRERKKQWEVMRVNLRGMVDALDLFGEGLRDCRELGLTDQLPGFDAALARLDGRLARIADLWEGGGELAGGDAELLEAAGIEFVPAEGKGLSRAAEAAAHGCIQQWDLLDRITRELLRGARVLAGLDPERDHPPEAIMPDRDRRVLWDPRRLINALFPALCFVGAYVFWILVDPPGGPSVPGTTGAIVLGYVLSRMNTMAMAFILLAGLWVCVAPIYFWLMPALDSGAGLLAMIFLYTLLFGYLGASKPVLKLVPILMLVNMAGISNQQTYSFMALMNGALLFLLCFGCIAVFDILWAPTRPEQILTAALRRFFRGCAGAVEGFAPGRDHAGVMRKRYFDSMMRDVPGQVQGVAKKLVGKKAGGCDEEGVSALVGGLQSITLRLQAVELAHLQLGEEDRQWHDEFGHAADELRGLLSATLERLSRLDSASDPEEEAVLQRLSSELEEHFHAAEQAGSGASNAFHALLGSVRGLLSAVAETRRAMGRFDWPELAKARF